MAKLVIAWKNLPRPTILTLRASTAHAVARMLQGKGSVQAVAVIERL